MRMAKPERNVYKRQWSRATCPPSAPQRSGNYKADAVIAAENGATSKELKAMFGWNSSREADRYTQTRGY